jgi:hypothetical protein
VKKTKRLGRKNVKMSIKQIKKWQDDVYEGNENRRETESG